MLITFMRSPAPSVSRIRKCGKLRNVLSPGIRAVSNKSVLKLKWAEPGRNEVISSCIYIYIDMCVYVYMYMYMYIYICVHIFTPLPRPILNIPNMRPSVLGDM